MSDLPVGNLCANITANTQTAVDGLKAVRAGLAGLITEGAGGSALVAVEVDPAGFQFPTDGAGLKG